LSTWRISGGVAALTLIVIMVGIGWVWTRQSERLTSARPDDTTLSERTTLPNTEPTTSLPSKDVPGRDMSDLPRYPGSVRVEYEHKKEDLLLITRLGYLSLEKLDVIRGFYRGVFRSEGWKVANVEYSGGEWVFLVVKGRREADIEIKRRDQRTRVDIESSEPLPEKKSTPDEKPQEQGADPAPPQPSQPAPPATPTPAPAPQSASPAPQSASPAPAAQPAPQRAPTPDDDYYEGGGEDGDDLSDDRGGDG